jgi:hypothetical protein
VLRHPGWSVVARVSLVHAWLGLLGPEGIKIFLKKLQPFTSQKKAIPQTKYLNSHKK